MTPQNFLNVDQGTDIKVIGVGGAGGNAVEHMVRSGVHGVSFVAANTDAQALGRSNADLKIALGTSGLGAGARPEKGKEAAMEQRTQIRDALAGSNMVFVTAGMGGGTGTGAAPVVAEVAKELGILTVGVVTKPFSFEGRKRAQAAEAGLRELAKQVDSLIVVQNDRLMEVLGDDADLDECFQAADDVLKHAVGGIAEVITYTGLVNVDFEDVRTVMSTKGRAMMGSATAEGPDRAIVAAEQAAASPLLEGVSLQGAKGVLVNITASQNGLKMREVRQVMEVIESFAAEDAHIIFGAVFDDSLGEALRVTVVATGLGNEEPALDGSQVGLGGHALKPAGIVNTPTNRPRTGVAATAGSAAPVLRVRGGQAFASAPGTNGAQPDYDVPTYLRQRV